VPSSQNTTAEAEDSARDKRCKAQAFAAAAANTAQPAVGTTATPAAATKIHTKREREKRGFVCGFYISVYHTGGRVSGIPDPSPSPN
jgi:hypothetical protein